MKYLLLIIVFLFSSLGYGKEQNDSIKQKELMPQTVIATKQTNEDELK